MILFKYVNQMRLVFLDSLVSLLSILIRFELWRPEEELKNKKEKSEISVILRMC